MLRDIRTKFCFRVNPESTLFQRWVWSMNQRWQVEVESTWISRWPTSRRYFNIYERWINVECLLGTSRHCLIIKNFIFHNFVKERWKASKNSKLLCHARWHLIITFAIRERGWTVHQNGNACEQGVGRLCQWKHLHINFFNLVPSP